MQQAATAHYRAFIEAASCLETVHGELQSVEARLQDLLGEAPRLATACEEFSRNSAAVMEQLAANKQLLGKPRCAAWRTQHPHTPPCRRARVHWWGCGWRGWGRARLAPAPRTRGCSWLHCMPTGWRADVARPAGSQPVLLELLEAPALMDTCVRNGIYDEALDIAACIARLGLLHPDMPVVQALTAQVRAGPATAGRVSPGAAAACVRRPPPPRPRRGAGPCGQPAARSRMPSPAPTAQHSPVEAAAAPPSLPACPAGAPGVAVHAGPAPGAPALEHPAARVPEGDWLPAAHGCLPGAGAPPAVPEVGRRRSRGSHGSAAGWGQQRAGARWSRRRQVGPPGQRRGCSSHACPAAAVAAQQPVAGFTAGTEHHGLPAATLLPSRARRLPTPSPGRPHLLRPPGAERRGCPSSSTSWTTATATSTSSTSQTCTGCTCLMSSCSTEPSSSTAGRSR